MNSSEAVEVVKLETSQEQDPGKVNSVTYSLPSTSEEEVIAAMEKHGREEIESKQDGYRARKEYERQVRKEYDEHWKHNKMLLARRELSSQDLKALVAFAEHFNLNFTVRENLGKLGFMDRQGLMISISQAF